MIDAGQKSSESFGFVAQGLKVGFYMAVSLEIELPNLTLTFAEESDEIGDVHRCEKISSLGRNKKRTVHLSSSKEQKETLKKNGHKGDDDDDDERSKRRKGKWRKSSR
ncbi:hypothetical protein RUM43_005064 [Polyplax serrata]|uniref:Uncharacterized protein n=1 Tax=Polyplax serrata TaxID=468196 RepID=A0AAN8XMH2_POLSC